MTSIDNAAPDEPNFEQPALPVFNLAYFSQAAEGVDSRDVDDIVAASHRNNARHGLTGLLVFGNGVFFQVLEGPKTQLLRLMDTLQKDPRHKNIVVFSEMEEFEDRIFPSWDMELVDAQEVQRVLSYALAEANTSRSAKSLRAMLDRVSTELDLD